MFEICGASHVTENLKCPLTLIRAAMALKLSAFVVRTSKNVY